MYNTAVLCVDKDQTIFHSSIMHLNVALLCVFCIVLEE